MIAKNINGIAITKTRLKPGFIYHIKIPEIVNRIEIRVEKSHGPELNAKLISP